MQAKEAVKQLNEAYKKQIDLVREENELKLQVRMDAIRSVQLENWHFLRGYDVWTIDLILFLKTPTRPYSCLDFIISSELV